VLWCICVSGGFQARNCMNTLQQCIVPVGMVYMGLSQQQVLERLRNTDLTETCGYVDILQTYIDKYRYVDKYTVFHNYRYSSLPFNGAFQSIRGLHAHQFSSRSKRYFQSPCFCDRVDFTLHCAEQKCFNIRAKWRYGCHITYTFTCTPVTDKSWLFDRLFKISMLLILIQFYPYRLLVALNLKVYLYLIHNYLAF